MCEVHVGKKLVDGREEISQLGLRGDGLFGRLVESLVGRSHQNRVAEGEHKNQPPVPCFGINPRIADRLLESGLMRDEMAPLRSAEKPRGRHVEPRQGQVAPSPRGVNDKRGGARKRFPGGHPDRERAVGEPGLGIRAEAKIDVRVSGNPAGVFQQGDTVTLGEPHLSVAIRAQPVVAPWIDAWHTGLRRAVDINPVHIVPRRRGVTGDAVVKRQADIDRPQAALRRLHDELRKPLQRFHPRQPQKTARRLHQPARAIGDGNIKPERLDQVRSHLAERRALGQRFAHELKIAVFQVAQPAVDEPRRARRRSRGDVEQIDQPHAHAVEHQLAQPSSH